MTRRYIIESTINQVHTRRGSAANKKNWAFNGVYQLHTILKRMGTGGCIDRVLPRARHTPCLTHDTAVRARVGQGTYIRDVSRGKPETNEILRAE